MRVHTITKSTAAKFATHTFPCTKCSNPIKAGEKFYMYQPNHSKPRRSHIEHGAPKQSELCQGKMSGVYAAVEGAEADISIARLADDASGLAEILTTCKDAVEEVKNEYEQSLSNMPEPLQEGATGQEIQEKIDALESFCDELDNAASECEDWDMTSEQQEKIDAAFETAENALGELSI